MLGNGKQQKTVCPCIGINKVYRILILKKTKGKFFLIGPNDDGVSVKNITKIICKYFNYNKKVIFGKKDYGWVGDVPKYRYDTKIK